jgi:hypothetical protein
MPAMRRAITTGVALLLACGVPSMARATDGELNGETSQGSEIAIDLTLDVVEDLRFDFSIACRGVRRLSGRIIHRQINAHHPPGYSATPGFTRFHDRYAGRAGRFAVRSKVSFVGRDSSTLDEKSLGSQTWSGTIAIRSVIRDQGKLVDRCSRKISWTATGAYPDTAP